MANALENQGNSPSIIPQGMDESIKIVKLDKALNQGNLKAFATIQANGFIIYGCRIIQQPNQKAWVSLPQTESKGKWYPLIEAEPALKKAISQVILKAYEVGP